MTDPTDPAGEEFVDRLYAAIQRHDAEINPYADDTTPREAHRLIRRALADRADDADVDDLAHDQTLCDPPMAEVVAGLGADQVRAVCIYLAQYAAARLIEVHAVDHDDDIAWWAAFAEISDILA
jgi:hypothetical protein